MKAKDCPVCQMSVSTAEYGLVHHGISYVFCSQQCEQNFIARPRLYLRHRAKEVLKKRVFKLAAIFNAREQLVLNDVMLKLMGIKDISFKQQRCLITYNLLEVTALQIEQQFEEAGVRLGQGWATQLKRGWVHYMEDNALNALAEPDGACCNKPPTKG